jgi:Ca2+-binding RTX toxin-like protein
MSIQHGTINADVLRGKVDEDNELWGHSESDDLSGGKLNDAIMGGKGSDRLWGDRGDDKLIGDSGNDTIYGSVNDDRLYGGMGDDWLSGGKNDDSLFGGKDDDVVDGNTGNDALSGGSGNDSLTGGAGDDVLFGGWGRDIVNAGSGDDFVMASQGSDILSGRSGFDTVDFSRMVGHLEVNLAKMTYSVGENGQNFGDLKGFEQVIANDFGSRLIGDDSHGTVFLGGNGDDWMRGKMGADILTGGAGSDTFAYLKKDTGAGIDTITDFQVGVDRLDLSDFMKGGRGMDAVRLADSADGAMIQGLVKGAWVDVVNLAGIDAHHTDLGILV